jgi:hypothetical protein
MSQSPDNPQEPEGPKLSLVVVEPADAEIAALLQFKPVPRAFKKEKAWTAPLQRLFIADLARHGSPNKACQALGKYRSGVDKLYKSADGASFRAAWDGAIALAEQRLADQALADNAGLADLRAPFVDQRRPAHSQPSAPDQGDEGQVRNEYDEWEDEGSVQRRFEEARDSITNKLLRARRLYLQEICGSPGKRAAFEMLTLLPIDWDRAERLEPQPDEPYHDGRMRKPDLMLTAENGWMGEMVHGPDKKAQLRRDMDVYRREQGLPPIDWHGKGDE